MRVVYSLAALMLVCACGATRVDSSAPEQRPADGGSIDAMTDSGVEPDASPRSPSVLAARVDINLELDEPTPIPGWDVTVTLLDARRVSVSHPRLRWAHSYTAVMRFEREGEDPVELTFGHGSRVHTLYDHGLALFGGTTLSVFPPGVTVYP